MLWVMENVAFRTLDMPHRYHNLFGHRNTYYQTLTDNNRCTVHTDQWTRFDPKNKHADMSPFKQTHKQAYFVSRWSVPVLCLKRQILWSWRWLDFWYNPGLWSLFPSLVLLMIHTAFGHRMSAEDYLCLLTISALASCLPIFVSTNSELEQRTIPSTYNRHVIVTA